MTAPRSRALLVLGMHRSGTSVLTGLLHLLGVEVSPHLMLAHADNPKGYWEHIDIVEAHEELLAALGSRWDDPLPLPAEWWLQPRVEPFRARLAAILQRDFAHTPLWALKDPRLCRLLPLWLPLLRELNCEPLCLITMRDLRATTRSLGQRDGFSESKALLLALDYLATAEHDSRDCPRAFVTYENLLQDAPAALARIGSELHLGWPKDLDSARPQIATFVDAGLARQNFSETEEPHPWLAQWETILAEKRDIPAALVEISAALATARVLFGPLLESNAHDLRAQISALSAAAEGANTVQRKFHERNLEYAELDRAHTDLRALRDRKNAQLAEAKEELEKAKSQIRELQTSQRSRLWKRLRP